MSKPSKRKKNLKNNNKSNRSDYLKGVLSVIAFIIPLPIYLVLILLICPAANSALVIIGILGTFIIGIGNICLVWLNNGRGIAIAIIIFGATLIAVSTIMMYPPIYSNLNQDYVNMYFLIWIAFIITAIWYAMFRGAISRIVRCKGASKSAINDALKGVLNYWFYDEIQKKYNIGVLFHLNKVFILLFVPSLCIHLIIGWHSYFSPVISLAVCLLCALNIPMWAVAQLSTRYDNGKKRTNFLGAILGTLFPLFVISGIITYLAKILG